MKAAAAVAEILKREGVGFLIGYPVNPIIEAAAEADIRTIIVRQERTGLHMADAVSRISSGDRIGVFAMQHGPGSENAFGGVAQAYGDSVPIVVLPGGYPRRITNIQPNFNSFLNFQHVTKWCEQVVVPAAVPDAMRRAFTQVKNGRPRPVLVEIPYDVFGQDLPEPLDYQPAPRARSGPDPRTVETVARVLVDAERPVIYAGTFPKEMVFVHGALDPAELNNGMPARPVLVGDAGLTLEALTAAVRDVVGNRARGKAETVAAEIRRGKAAWLDQWMPKLTS